MDKIEFKDEFIHRVSKIGRYWNAGEPASKIWGLLVFENKSLTQKEIAKQSQYSLSLVSPSLKVLENLGMISITGRRGKEKLYKADVSLVDTFERSIRLLMENDIKPLTSSLSSQLETVKDEEVRERLELLLKDYKKMNMMLNIFSRILETKKSLSLSRLKALVV